MFCHLNYSIDKNFFRNQFWKKYDNGFWHVEKGKELKFWWKVFGIRDIIVPIISDLGLENMDIIPRFSYQLENTRLPDHIDIDRIVGINFNLQPETPSIHLKGKEYPYECCLVDVGAILHSVESVQFPRLVLKLAIREKWADVYKILDEKGLIDHNETEKVNPTYKTYNSLLSEQDKMFVK
jgi:hypothetical protein